MDEEETDGRIKKKKGMDANTNVIQACVNAAALLKTRHCLFFLMLDILTDIA